MTLNRQRLLRYTEYAAVSASVAGAIAAVATRQLVYGVAPLSVAAALNLVNRRQWEQQIEQRLAQTTTQIGQRFDDLAQQNRQLEQRLQALPEVTVENFAQISDLQALREEGSRLFQQLSDDLQVLRQNLARQERGIDRSELDSITADLRQLQLSLAALESLNFDDRLQGLEQQPAGEPTGVEDAISPLRTDLHQLRSDLHQLREEVTRLQVLLREAPSTATVSPPYEVGTELPRETTPAPEFQWQPPQLPSNQDFDLELNLGIDFGTGFTKVCFRSLDNNYSEIVTFAGEDSEVHLEQALLSSKIAILEDGTLMTGLTAAEWASMNQPVQKTIEFIKMRLAHLDLPEDGDWRLERIPELDDSETVENLCAYYLSKVITRAQEWIQNHRADLFKNRKARWSVNIGVPVEYCDSPALKRFERVLSLAWLLANTPSSNGNLTINSLSNLGSYLHSWMQKNLKEDLDCFTTPEISAAVWSFLSEPNIPEKFYTVFDFGDGTLDGAAFRFWIEDGETRVDFYSGHVDPLGVTAFSQQAAVELEISPSRIKETLHSWQSSLQDNSIQNRMSMSNARKNIQKLIGKVVYQGHRKHIDNRSILVQEDLGDRVEVFLGGGGGHNPFFFEAVKSTHSDFNQGSSDIPPYRIKSIPAPKKLELNGISQIDFHRFSVAYGLCIPVGEGPNIRLPSQVEKRENSISRWSKRVPRYEDTKDLM
jgi:hypothetical protein